MKHASTNTGRIGPGYADLPAHLPFTDVVGPLMHVGEEIVRYTDAFVSSLRRCRGAFRRWRSTRITANALRALDDNVLEDIGVRRYEIDDLARRLAVECSGGSSLAGHCLISRHR